VKKNLVFILILLISLIFRIIVNLQFKKNDIFYFHPIIDELEFYQNSKYIKNGDFSHPEMAFKPPFYSYFLSIFNSIFKIKITQNILGIISLIFIYFFSKKIFDNRVAFLSLIFLSFYWVLVYFETQLLSETLYVFLLSSSIFLFFYEFYGFSSIFYSLSVLTRPNSLIFFPFILYYFIKKKKYSSMCFFVFTFIYILSFFAIENYQITGEFIIWGANSGINFYIGNTKSGIAPIPTGPKWEKLLEEPLKENVYGFNNQSRYWFKRTFMEIAKNPLNFIYLNIKKFIFFFNYQELSNNKIISIERQKSSLLSIPVLPGFYLFGPFLLFSLIFGLKHNKILYFSMVFYILGVLLFFISDRYRYPFVFIFTPFSFYVFFREKNNLKKFIIFFICCIFVWIPWYKYNPEKYIENDYNTGLVYMEEGKFKLAEKYFKEALKKEPNFSQCYNQLGMIELYRKNIKDAKIYFEKAVSLNPNNISSLNNLGVCYANMKDYEKALKYFLKALSINPLFEDAKRNLYKLEVEINNIKYSRAFYSLRK